MQRDEKVERKITKRWKEREEKCTEKYNKLCGELFLGMRT
jgi:hypothetical protein